MRFAIPEFEKCIFCQRAHSEQTVEHIVPRTLGNLHYVLPKGKVCRKCNQRFSHFENRVVSSPPFLRERARLHLLREGHQAVDTPLHASDMALFLLKIGFEAMYMSRRKEWSGRDFSKLLDFLLRGWTNPIFQTPDTSDGGVHFRSIPGWIERFRLQNNRIRLEYATHEDKLFFRFMFGRIVGTIRMA